MFRFYKRLQLLDQVIVLLPEKNRKKGSTNKGVTTKHHSYPWVAHRSCAVKFSRATVPRAPEKP